MLRLRPISLRDANEYVRQHHRHHKPVVGHKFSIGCEADGELVGVIIAGRPVSRYLDDGFTLEVTRLCTNGAKNACSFLYGAAARAAAAMGYKRIITYTLESENGASLRASGWICQGKAGGLRWTGKRQPKEDQYPAQMKLRYEKQLRKEETVNGICSGPEGSYARVSLNFFAFNSNGNKGIACGLGNIQKVRDGEPLGGKSTAADDFATLADDDFLA